MNRGHVGGPELQSARAALASCALPACVWPPRGARTPDSGTWAQGGQRPGPEPQEPRACETSSPGSLRQPRSSPPSSAGAAAEPAALFLQQLALGRGWGRALPSGHRAERLPGLGPFQVTQSPRPRLRGNNSCGRKLRFCFCTELL